KLPLPRKPLQHDPETRLPIPHVNVILEDTHQSRESDHYYTTIRDNLMYMSYVHAATPRKQIHLAYNPNDPYVKNRHNPPVGVPQWTRQSLPPVTPENVLELDRIQLHCFLRESITSRSNLLGTMIHGIPGVVWRLVLCGRASHLRGCANCKGEPAGSRMGQARYFSRSEGRSQGAEDVRLPGGHGGFAAT
ncbi:hypothetical protein BC835DRAFT_1466921, partial [Cytidiella melzeri]